MPRNVSPDPDPIVALLDSEDVVSLIGFVGDGRTPDSESAQPALRIHPDRNLQRWLEIPRESVVHSQQVDPDDLFTRSVVWVQREAMVEPMVTDDDFETIIAALEPAPLSPWTLIPETRLVAADLLGLLHHVEDEEGGS